MVTTGTELQDYRVVRNFGVVRGITVRSRSVLGNLAAGIQTIVGGNITVLTELCEKARGEAYELLLEHAGQHGANAILAMRYDANEVMQGYGSPGIRYRRAGRKNQLIRLLVRSYARVVIESRRYVLYFLRYEDV
jgi:uncharacterized protein YbjQ (UPF0145 family)